MPSLAHLKIGSAPAAFAEFAQKHNEVVSLIESIEAATGLDIKITHTPAKKLKVGDTPNSQAMRSKGRIRIGLKSGAILGQVGATFGATGGGGGNAATTLHYLDGTVGIDIDGSNGVTVTNIGNGYVTALYPSGNFLVTNFTGTKQVAYSPNSGNLTYLNGTNGVNVTANGILVQNVAAPFGNYSTHGAGVSDYTYNATINTRVSGNKVLVSNSTLTGEMNDNGFILTNASSGSLSILYSQLSQTITVRTFQGCNNGNVGNYLAIASDFF